LFSNKILEKIYKLAHEYGQFHVADNLVDKFYINTSEFTQKKQLLFESTQKLNGLISNNNSSKNKKALVFMLRGLASQTLQLYMLACALKKLDYDVNLVKCEGDVERCGFDQENTYLRKPPFPCNACRSFSNKVFIGNFKQISLNQYIVSGEEKEIDNVKLCEEDHIYGIDKLNLLKENYPFLLRYYYGNIEKTKAISEQNQEHVKAGIRYVLRFKKLIEDQQPSCIVLFNGLFFPENLFLKTAKEKNIPVITLECGCRKETSFIALNEPACHYKIDSAWNTYFTQINDSNVSMAKEYLSKRMLAPEDPSGIIRDVSDQDWSKYNDLAQKPYVIFYAPVIHDTASMEKGGPFKGVFDAIDHLVSKAVEYKTTLIIRSHPDERDKFNPSKYSIYQYLKDKEMLSSDYIKCFDSSQKWDPYKLAYCAQAIAMFNGTLAIELSALGFNVYNLANSNYCNKGFTFDIKSKEDLCKIFDGPLKLITLEQQNIALKYLYFYTFISSLNIGNILKEYSRAEFRFNENGDIELQKKEFNNIVDRIKFLLGNN
jgi:hypothetical protein